MYSGWACGESRPALVSVPQPPGTADVRKRFRAKRLPRESKLKRRLSRVGAGLGKRGRRDPAGPSPLLVPGAVGDGSGFLLQGARGTLRVAERGCSCGAAGRAICAPLPPLRERLFAQRVPWSGRAAPIPVGWPGGQSWAGGSGGTSSLLVKPATSKVTRQAENDPHGELTLQSPRVPECLQCWLPAGKGFPQEKGGKVLPTPALPGSARAAV